MFSLSSRLAVMLIAVVAVGLIALPNTVSLFAGQHYWYAVNDTGNNVPCEKCHADVFEELNQSIGATGFHDFNGNNIADKNDCAACHRNDASITYASDNGTKWVSGKEAHAASVVACMLCHQWNAGSALHNSGDAGPAAG